MADLSSKTSNELVTMFMSGNADQKAAIQAELKRRDSIVESATASLQCYFTHKGGVYCQNPNWQALAESGNTYCPAINFTSVDQIVDVITPGSPTNEALLKLTKLSADDRAKAIEAHRVKKQEQAVKQRTNLLTRVKSGKASQSDLDKFDSENPGIAALCTEKTAAAV